MSKDILYSDFHKVWINLVEMLRNKMKIPRGAIIVFSILYAIPWDFKIPSFAQRVPSENIIKN